MINIEPTLREIWYEKNKHAIRKKQREYEANKRKETKEKLERLAFLENYIEEQGLAI